MTTFLNRFVKTDGMSELEKRTAYGKAASIFGNFLNVMLSTMKIIGGLLTKSVSVLADGLNNLSDAGSSIVTLAGFRIASQKPDPEPPFGHGRVEYIAGLIVSAMILVMAYELVSDSISRILNPVETEFRILVIVFLLISILVKCGMALFNKRLGDEINSPTLLAVSKDSLSDVVSTSVVLLTTIITHFTGWPYLDPICGLLVACFIAYSGVSAARETINPLLGNAPDPEFVKEVRRIMRHQDPKITGIHDLVVHDYGPGRRMVSLHAEVPADGNLLELHDIIDNAEQALEEQLHCTAVIHMDPIVTDDPVVLKLRTQVASLIQEIHPSLSMHDFRTVPGPTHTNLVFDVLVPFGLEMTDEELVQEINDAIHDQIGENYHAVVHVDTDYAVKAVPVKHG